MVVLVLLHGVVVRYVRSGAWHAEHSDAVRDVLFLQQRIQLPDQCFFHLRRLQGT